MGNHWERNWQEMKEEYGGRHMPEEQVRVLQDRIKQAKKDRRKIKRRRRVRNLGMAAAAAVVFLILPNTSAEVAHAMSSIPVVGRLVDVVTFRDYQYESERNVADVNVPQLVAEELQGGGGTAEVSAIEATGEKQEDQLKKSTEEINEEIQRISDQMIQEFEKNLQNEWGYQDILIQSEVVTSREDYFTLKLIVYQGAGSGAEWNYFYTIDLNTGERLALKDLFIEGADYITPVSNDIKRQMQEQMDRDENLYYWLHDEIDGLNFKEITEETSFYVNEDGNIVVVFNEGDVAPMYMGVVEFVISPEAVSAIRID